MTGNWPQEWDDPDDDFLEEALRRPGALVSAEFRLQHADGSYRDIEAIGQNLLHEVILAGGYAPALADWPDWELFLRLARHGSFASRFLNCEGDRSWSNNTRSAPVEAATASISSSLPSSIQVYFTTACAIGTSYVSFGYFLTNFWLSAAT